MMKTTVDLSDELVRELKVRAAQEGRTMKSLWVELFTRMSKEPAKDARRKRPLPAKAGSK